MKTKLKPEVKAVETPYVLTAEKLIKWCDSLIAVSDKEKSAFIEMFRKDTMRAFQHNDVRVQHVIAGYAKELRDAIAKEPEKFREFALNHHRWALENLVKRVGWHADENGGIEIKAMSKWVQWLAGILELRDAPYADVLYRYQFDSATNS